jgi:hypothetical protein
MRLPGFVSFILVLLLALVAGGVGYAIGVNSAVATTAAAAAAAGDGSTVVVTHAGWWGGFWFFPFFGFFFVILFFAIIFGIIRRAAWGGPRGPRGWGGGNWAGYGPYGWTSGDPNASGSTTTAGNVPPGVDQMLKDWHRDAHGPAATPSDAQGTGRPPGTQG